MKFFIFITFLVFSFANAHHKIYSPVVEEGRQSFEWRGHFDVDDRTEKNKSHHHVLETEYSWTSFWQSEVELHISDKEDAPLDWEKTEFQNQVQIADLKYFAGAFYFSYNFVSEGKEADEIEYKYLNKIYNDNYGIITNFIFEKQVGNNASGSTTFDLSNYIYSKNLIFNTIDFGIIGFSDFGEISDFKVFGEQEHQYGFQIESSFEHNDIDYEWALGYLHGLTDASANHTMIWNFEVEFN
ncbi:MAG: hypothetical protein VX009_01995 [Pseudomonadota bacterium]|nr:hypothetical protein [Pseudomonadota bacterium]